MHVEHTVDFGARMKNLPSMMRKPGQVGAILLAGHRLGHLALLDIEDLDGLIIPRRHQMITLVVEVKGGYIVGIFSLSIECLEIISPTRIVAGPANRGLHTPCWGGNYG